MKNSGKILLAALTLWPILYMIFFIGYILTMIVSAPTSAQTGPPIALFVAHGFTMLLMLGLTVYYVIHALNNPRLKIKENERLLWVIILIVGGFIGQGVYWYLHIWKE